MCVELTNGIFKFVFSVFFSANLRYMLCGNEKNSVQKHGAYYFFPDFLWMGRTPLRVYSYYQCTDKLSAGFCN